MDRFYTADNKKLSLGVDGRGITFICLSTNGNPGDAIQVGQDWTSVNFILSKLRKSQKYSTRDNALSVWKQGEELYVNLRALDRRLRALMAYILQKAFMKDLQKLDELSCN